MNIIIGKDESGFMEYQLKFISEDVVKLTSKSGIDYYMPVHRLKQMENIVYYMGVVQLADFVYDNRTSTILKCRYGFDTLLSLFYKANEAETSDLRDMLNKALGSIK